MWTGATFAMFQGIKKATDFSALFQGARESHFLKLLANLGASRDSKRSPLWSARAFSVMSDISAICELKSRGAREGPVAGAVPT